MSRLHHLDLTVSDLERSVAYYHRVLARLAFARKAALPSEVPEWTSAWLSIGLHPAKTMQPHDRYAPGLHHVAFNADSREAVDTFHRFLRAEGVTILDPPAEYDYSPGYYAVFFADPDGLKLELVHTPSWTPR